MGENEEYTLHAVWKNLNEPLYTRVNANNVEDENGDYILFGSYPQSEVTDTTLKTTLNTMAGELPTESDSKNWTSYEYYILSSNDTDFMWYQDVEYKNNKYRGVYFIKYKCGPTTESSAENSCQDNNGYYINNIYWFKFEPIKWRILTITNNNAVLLSENSIDNEMINLTGNDYSQSHMRNWLNEVFYINAFNDNESALVETTELDNGNYAKINDKVWLPSLSDVDGKYCYSSSNWGQEERQLANMQKHWALCRNHIMMEKPDIGLEHQIQTNQMKRGI